MVCSASAGVLSNGAWCWHWSHNRGPWIWNQVLLLQSQSPHLHGKLHYQCPLVHFFYEPLILQWSKKNINNIKQTKLFNNYLSRNKLTFTVAKNCKLNLFMSYRFFINVLFIVIAIWFIGMIDILQESSETRKKNGTMTFNSLHFPNSCTVNATTMAGD